MIQAEPDPQKRDEYVQRLMNLPNQVDITVLGPMQSSLSQTHTHDSLAKVAIADSILWLMSSLVIQKWSEIIGQARQSVEVLKDQEVIRTVLNILQVCISLILICIL